MNEFVEWWHQHATKHPLFWECPPKRIGSGQIRTLDTLQFANWERSELYLRATTVNSIPKSGRGGSKLAGEILGVWLDIDFADGIAKDHRYPPRDRLDDLLGQLPDPSALVETGGGLHAYWKLSEPLSTLENTDLLECWWRKCNNIWQTEGYLLDNVLNPDRLLRLPGSINFKQNGFQTSWEINDLEYTPDQLVGDCDITPPSDFQDNWIDQPTLQTAFNETIDMNQVWESQGFQKTGISQSPAGTHYLRPGSTSNKSLTVWDDTGVTTIHSTVVLDKLKFERQHISPYNLCDKLGVLTSWREQAEQRLETLETEFKMVLAKARQGDDTSDSRWHHAAEFKLMEERFVDIRKDKHDLVRPFPTQLLPEIISDAAEDVADIVGSPVEMAYTIALGVMAMAISGEVRVDMHDTPISLYVLVAGAPSSGKSPTMRKLMKALKQQDASKVAAWRPHAKRYRQELEAVENQIAKHEETGDPQPIEALEAKHKELSAKCEPPNRIMGKTTPAALLHALSFKQSAAVESGEGADWLLAFRDSNSAEINGDSLLDIYDGHPTTKSTKTDGLITIDCTLSILLATQSGNLSKFTNLQESGFWQRFLYVDLPKKQPVKRGALEYGEDPESIQLFNTMTLEIAELSMKYFTGKRLTCSVEAKNLFLDWQCHTKQRGNENHPEVFDERYGNNRLYESISKAHSHAIRIAGLIAIVRAGTTGEMPEVTLDDMTAGMGIADWYYDRRVADSLTEIDGMDDGMRKDLFQLLDIKGYVTPTILGRESNYFKRDDTNANKAWLDKLVEEGLIVSHPRSQYKRPS